MTKMDEINPAAPSTLEKDEADTPAPPKPAARRSRVRWTRLALTAVVIGAVVWLGTPWIIARFTQVHINDARIAATVVTVSSEVAGRVTELPVLVGDCVAAGDVLASIDTESSQSQLAAVIAKLAATDAQLDELEKRKYMHNAQLAARRDAATAGIAVAVANHASALAVLRNTQTRHDRVAKLAEQNVSSQQALDEVTMVLDSATQQERAAYAAIETARANLAIVEADAAQIAVLDAQIDSVRAGRTGIEAERRLKEIDLEHRRVVTSFDGIVDATFVDVGEYVTPGTRLLMYHAPENIWIDANVKETEFSKLRVGSAATITVDAFPGRTFEGEVIGLGGAATSQLALLPSPNPSGNFTKVTQRLPIRVSIDAEGMEMRPGMMVEIYVDVAG